MQLLATTYQNIGPFLDRTLTVCFRQGKFLIKAPIGSGKSFLFFDGPVFGLYKYSGRTMLSMKAKEGYIKVLMEAGDGYFLVVRNLTRTKSGGDSVKSKLFQVDMDASSAQQIMSDLGNVINENSDIENVLLDNNIKLEEVVFKNETDLQQNMTDFLPPREVYTSTTFLMQDSENMFEMTPADRINVFKNIFGLLDIDEAKDLISDAKKETTALLKSRRNTDDVNTKLQRAVHEYLELVEEKNEQWSDEILSHASDWTLVKEKLSIENFDIASLPLASWQELAVRYDQERAKYQSLLGQLQALEKQHKANNEETVKLAKQKEEAKQQITELEKKLATDNSSIVKKLQQEKNSLIQQQEQIITALPLQELHIDSISDLVIHINDLLQKGKSISKDKDHLDEKLKTVEKQMKEFDQKKVSIEEQLKLLAENRKKQEFVCDLIGDKPCPYVDLINKGNLKSLDKQEEHFQQALKDLDKDALEKEREKIVKEITQVEKELATARDEYKKYSSPEIKENIETYNTLDKKRQEIDKELLKYENEQDKQDKYKEEIVQLKAKITHYEDAQANIAQQEKKLADEIAQLKSQTDINQLDKIEATLSSISKGMKILEYISELVGTHKNNLLMIKQLEEKETMLGQLYNIFSKEIMIYVLQQTLPLFADVLNNLLAKVVDYTVSFETKNVRDKVELEIKIHDSKGERLVKSLSGGQKTVLRLTWTLAICIFTRSNALFLDETVNNIDRDTIGKVADLIEDFTKTHEITFYIITHSEAIQEMEIWDKVISL